MFIIRKVLLQIGLPITLAAILVLVIVQIMHSTLFNPQWYKDSLRSSGAYQQLAAPQQLPAWIRDRFSATTTTLVQNQVEGEIDRIFTLIRDDKEISETFGLKESEILKQSDAALLVRVQQLYRVTKTVLNALYIIVPVLVLLMIWILIQEVVSFLKMLFSAALGTAIVLLATGTLGSLFKDTLLEMIIPDDWQALVQADFVMKVINQLFNGVMQVLLIVGGVSLVVALIVWFALRSFQRKQKSEPTSMPPTPPSVPEQPGPAYPQPSESFTPSAPQSSPLNTTVTDGENTP